jgi:hypothetical protein
MTAGSDKWTLRTNCSFSDMSRNLGIYIAVIEERKRYYIYRKNACDNIDFILNTKNDTTFNNITLMLQAYNIVV